MGAQLQYANREAVGRREGGGIEVEDGVMSAGVESGVDVDEL